MQLTSFAKNDPLEHRLFVGCGHLGQELPLQSVIGKVEGSNSSTLPLSFELISSITEVPRRLAEEARRPECPNLIVNERSQEEGVK